MRIYITYVPMWFCKTVKKYLLALFYTITGKLDLKLLLLNDGS